MQQEKGQIEILFVILAVVGVILFINFTKGRGALDIKPVGPPSQEESVVPSSEPKMTPNPNPAPDSIAPYRFNPAPVQGLSSNTRQTVISLETSEKATCKYDSVSGLSYDAMQYTLSNSVDGIFHSASVTALSEGGVYNYFIKCLDQFGNKNIDDFVITFWVNNPTDTTPPILSNAYPLGDTVSIGASGAIIIGVSTNESASCRYSWTQGVSYDSMSNSLSPTDGTKRYHTAKITGLVPGSSYNYFVRCKDLNGNVNTGDVMVSFIAAP